MKINIAQGIGGLMLMGLVACNQKPVETAQIPIDAPLPAPVEISNDSLIAKGQYLVGIMGCHDCHSPKKPGGMEPDPNMLLSGHPAGMPFDKKVVNKSILGPYLIFNGNISAFAGPWGVSFAANLTSDETGIGNWTEEQFSKAIREGKYKGLDGGRQLLPPMPWPNFSHLKDDDLKAIFAFLKSTKPIKNSVPAPIAFTDL